MENKYQLANIPHGLNRAGGLAPSGVLDSSRAIAESMRPEPYKPPADASGMASAAYSASLKQFFVSSADGGFTFDADNDTAAVESMKVYDPSRPSALPPGDWTALTPEGYAAYVEGIRNPGMGKLAKKNFGIGVDNMQALVGSGLKFLGAEETGQSIVDQQEKDLSKTLPYQRSASEIGSDPNRGIIDWFVANLAQQGPNMVESAVTAVLGGIAGAAAGGGPNPLTAVGGALAGLVGKAAFKNGLLAAAKKYSAGEVLEIGERKLLLEAAGITAAAEDVAVKLGLEQGAKSAFKQAGRIGGAGLATLASNEAMGVADVYSEPGASRGYALAASVPYSLLESSTEFLLAGRLFGDIASGSKPFRDLGYRGKALELLRRTTVGGTVGGVLEGGVEAGQEGLIMAANPSVDWDAPESVTRLFNSFAAGAGVGGPIGSIANLAGRAKPANLLNPTQEVTPVPEAPAAPAPAAPSPAGLQMTQSPIGDMGTAEPRASFGPQTADVPVAPQGPVAPGNNVSAQATAAPAAPIPASVTPGRATLDGPAAVLTRRRPVADTQINTASAPAELAIPPVSVADSFANYGTTPMSMGETLGQQPAPAMPAYTQPAALAPPAAPAAPELNLDFEPLPAPAAQPLVSGVDRLKKKKPAAAARPLLERNYNAVADKLGDDMNAMDYANPLYETATNRVLLAERLATLSDDNLKKLAPVWDAKFEPDVTTTPEQVLSLIDRTLGVKPKTAPKALSLKKGKTATVVSPSAPEIKQLEGVLNGIAMVNIAVSDNAATVAQKLKKGAASQAQKQIVTKEVTAPAAEKLKAKGTAKVKPAAPSTKPVTAPVAEAGKTTPGEAAKKLPDAPAPVVVQRVRKGRSLKKEEPPPPGDNVKNAEGVAAPDNKTAEQAAPEDNSETIKELNDAIESWNDPKDTVGRELAARYVISLAFSIDSNDRTYGYTPKALAALDSMVADAVRKGGEASAALDEAIIAEAITNTRKDLRDLVAKRHLGDRVKVRQEVREFKVGFGQEPISKVLATATGMSSLADIIDVMLTSRGKMQDTAARTQLANDAKIAYNALRKAGEDPIIHGVKASKLFKNNRLDIQMDAETGVFRLAVGMDLARDVMTASDAPSGMFNSTDGVPLTKKFAPAETKMKVDALLNRFKMRPKSYVFRNIADMKAKNPGLYARAAAARDDGSFNPNKHAAGYSFGSTVLVFSDYIRSDRHLSLVVSHETLGHFGLRAFMSQASLSAGLDEVYNSDTRLKRAVDRAVAASGQSRAEAIEEYIADYAAVIDNSVLQSMWNMLKNALNKLGIKFEDDYARMLINQSRRYVRNGGSGGSFFSATSLFDTMTQMEADHSSGRFSEDPLTGENLSGNLLAAQAASENASRMGGIMGIKNYLQENGPAKTFGAQSNAFKDVVDKIVGAVETLDHRASRSYGLTEVYKLFEKRHNLSRQLLAQFQALTSFTHKANWGVLNKDAPTEADKAEAGQLLAFAALSKLDTVDVKLMDSYGELAVVDDYGNIDEDNLQRVSKVIIKDGFVTADEFRKGLEWTDSLGHTQKYPAREIDESSKYWKIYVEQRNAVNAAALALLRANYNALSMQNTTTYEGVLKTTGVNNAKFTEQDAKTLQAISGQFYRMYTEGIKKDGKHVHIDEASAALANEFIDEVTRVMDPKNGDTKVKDWLDANPAEDASKFQGPEFKEIIAGLKDLSKIRLNNKSMNQIKQILQNVALAKADVLRAEYYAKRTILSSYAPLKRDGKFQIKLVALDADGRVVKLDPAYRGVLPYSREDSEKVAITTREAWDKLYAGKYDVHDEAGDAITVTFRAEHSTARQTAEDTSGADYADFMYMLERTGININPATRQQLVEKLTAQNATARSNLERTGNPGWRANIVRNISEHLETAAHVAAKRTYHNKLDTVLYDDNMWLGDADKLQGLKDAYSKPGLPPAQRDYLKREYDDYAYKYSEMASMYTGHVVDVNGKKVSPRTKGELFREEGKKLLRWYSKTLNITDSTEDKLSEDVFAKAKIMTVLIQLGMSVATAVVNVGSLVTHSTTYMAYYNPKNGFGMGFGMVKSSTALSRALGDLKNNNFTDPVFIEKLLANNTYGEYGLTKSETEFLLEGTATGLFDAAQYNALIGSARGQVHSNRINDAIQKWMYMFAYTEQLNRRVTGLAAYRLELARIEASTGLKADSKEARALAYDAAHKAVITSQGEYSMFNRPELARGNFGQYIFMYKMFTALTVRMLRGMPPKGQLTFLALMIVASGIKGVPFAEDLMDLVDTLAQMLGLKMTSIEKEAYQLFDALAPGYAPYFMRGVLDQLTGSTVSSKVGMGDIIPLSGSLKYGADFENETKQFLGPVFGASIGMIGWSQMIGKYGAEAVGIKSDATTFNDLLRNSPLAVLRSVGDSMAYMDTGAITNIRGQVVSRDAGVSTFVARLLGFYPAESTRQNDIIRVSKMGAAYSKAIKSELVNAYVQAGIRGDKDQMKHISTQVREWNIDAKGTGLEVKDFQNAVKKSLAEASRESVLRYRRTVSKQMQPHLDELMRLQGVDPTD